MSQATIELPAVPVATSNSTTVTPATTTITEMDVSNSHTSATASGLDGSHGMTKSSKKSLFKISDNLIFPQFKPRYIWENGPGSKYKYVGDGHEHSEAWSSLFLDLVFVAMCSKITHLFIQCHYSGELVLIAFCTFQIFFNCRADNDSWMMNFGADDLKHRFFNLAYVFGIVIMTLNTNLSYEDHSGDSSLIHSVPVDDGHHRQLGGSDGDIISSKVCYLDPIFYRNFMGGFLIVRFCWCLLCAHAMVKDKSKGVLWQFGFKFIFRLISCLAFLIGSFAVTDVHEKAYVLILVSCSDPFAHMAGIISIKLKQLKYTSKAVMASYYPINYLIFQQRYAVFILIVLGEGIIALLIPAWSPSYGVSVFFICLFGLILLYNISMQYFDLVLRYEGEMHAMRRDMIAGSIFFILHPYLGFFLLIMSGGMAILLITTNADSATEEQKVKGKLMLTIGISASSVIMMWLRTLHKGISVKISDVKHTMHFTVRVLACVSHFLCLIGTHYVSFTPLRNLVTHSVLTFFPFIFEGIVHHTQSRTTGNKHGEGKKKEHIDVTHATSTASGSSSESIEKSTSAVIDGDKHSHDFWDVDEFGHRDAVSSEDKKEKQQPPSAADTSADADVIIQMTKPNETDARV